MSPADGLRILIADDNEVVRRSFAMLLSQEKSWSVSGEASNSEEVLEQGEELHPDVILWDVSIASIDELETPRLLTGRLPDKKVVITSQHDPHHPYVTVEVM